MSGDTTSASNTQLASFLQCAKPVFVGFCLEGKEQVMHYVIKLEASLNMVGLEQSLKERAPSRNTSKCKGMTLYSEGKLPKRAALQLGQSSLPWATGRLVTTGRT